VHHHRYGQVKFDSRLVLLEHLRAHTPQEIKVALVWTVLPNTDKTPIDHASFYDAETRRVLELQKPQPFSVVSTVDIPKKSGPKSSVETLFSTIDLNTEPAIVVIGKPQV